MRSTVIANLLGFATLSLCAEDSVVMVNVSAVQMSMSTEAEANLDKAEHLIRQAAQKGAQIILLPELFETQYFAITPDPQYYDLAKPLNGNARIARFAALAKSLSVVLIYPFYELAGGNVARYNSAAVIDADGTVLGVYRKSHIPDDDGWFEKFYFAPGDTGFRVWKTRYATIGVGICWDQWFPESHRLLTLAGAQVLFFPTAIGYGPAPRWWGNRWQMLSWHDVQVGQSIANSVPIVVSNRHGAELDPAQPRNISFWGNSFITHADGHLAIQASDLEDTALVQAVEVGTSAMRSMWIRDRRVDLYRNLLSNDAPKTDDSFGASSKQSDCSLEALESVTPVYQFPAEWEPHERIWIGWPPFEYLSAAASPDGRINADVSTDIACILADHGIPVSIAANDQHEGKKASGMILARCSRHVVASGLDAAIQIVTGIPHFDAWWRDMGPQFLVRQGGGASGALRVLDVGFNSWGFALWDPSYWPSAVLDGNVARLSAMRLGMLTSTHTDWVHEGGNIEIFRPQSNSGGRNRLMSVRAVVEQRNPEFSLEQIEERLLTSYGYKDNENDADVLWLSQGGLTDELPWRGPFDAGLGEAVYTYGTGGHVDEVARFTPDGKVLLARFGSSGGGGKLGEENRRRAEANADAVRRANLTFIDLPEPPLITIRLSPGSSMYDSLKAMNYSGCDSSLNYTWCQAFPHGKPVLLAVAASYANYLVTNGLVIMQKYCVPGICKPELKEADDRARQVLEQVYSPRKIIAINALAVNLGGGGVHCYTQQQPVVGGGRHKDIVAFKAADVADHQGAPVPTFYL